MRIKKNKKKKEEKLLIGRKDKVDFPDLGLKNIDAKIDTGAYTSSIHCDEIKTKAVDGKKKVVFKIHDPERLYTKGTLTKKFPLVKKKKVKSSFGETEERYIINTSVLIFEKKFDIELSLTNRSNMGHPVLLGRKLLKKNFIVDVSKYNLSYRNKIRGKGI